MGTGLTINGHFLCVSKQTGGWEEKMDMKGEKDKLVFLRMNVIFVGLSLPQIPSLDHASIF